MFSPRTALLLCCYCVAPILSSTGRADVSAAEARAAVERAAGILLDGVAPIPKEMPGGRRVLEFDYCGARGVDWKCRVRADSGEFEGWVRESPPPLLPEGATALPLDEALEVARSAASSHLGSLADELEWRGQAECGGALVFGSLPRQERPLRGPLSVVLASVSWEREIWYWHQHRPTPADLNPPPPKVTREQAETIALEDVLSVESAPDLAVLEVVFGTHDGRPVWGLRLGDPEWEAAHHMTKARYPAVYISVDGLSGEIVRRETYCMSVSEGGSDFSGWRGAGAARDRAHRARTAALWLAPAICLGALLAIARRRRR